MLLHWTRPWRHLQTWTLGNDEKQLSWHQSFSQPLASLSLAKCGIWVGHARCAWLMPWILQIKEQNVNNTLITHVHDKKEVKSFVVVAIVVVISAVLLLMLHCCRYYNYCYCCIILIVAVLLLMLLVYHCCWFCASGVAADVFVLLLPHWWWCCCSVPRNRNLY